LQYLIVIATRSNLFQHLFVVFGQLFSLKTINKELLIQKQQEGVY